MVGKRLLIDTSKCQACKACQAACKQWHCLEAEDTTFTGTYQNPPNMSGANLTVVKFTETEIGGKLKWLFLKDGCRHCDPTSTASGPYCVGACTARPRAIIRQTNGIVRIDPALCRPPDGTGPFACGSYEPKPCLKACPYHVPQHGYEKEGSPIETAMRKCDFCYNRFGNLELPQKSRKPTCQVTCPPGAISSGKADDILTKAKKRRNYLRNHGFPAANIYPPQVGGFGPTHVIWVLTEAPSVYGL